MHAAARAPLLTPLLALPAVGALYDRWTLETLAGRQALALHDRLARAARAAGSAHVQDLLAALPNAADGRLAVPLAAADTAGAARDSGTVAALLAEAAELFESLTAARAELDPEPLSAEAVALVRDRWRLPWPWLAWELVRWWTGWLEAAPFGLRPEVRFRVEST